jgi:hypothetical protein
MVNSPKIETGLPNNPQINIHKIPSSKKSLHICLTQIICLKIILKSPYGLTSCWTTEGSEFEPDRGQEFSLLHVIQTCYVAHPAFYPVGTGGFFPGIK